MVLNDLVIRVKTRSHRGNVSITTDAITQQIIDAINDSRREIIRLIPKQWLRKTSQFNTVPATIAGGATKGTLTSGSAPQTTPLNPIAGIAIGLNGEAEQTVVVSSSASGGPAIAQSIQNGVQALIAVNTYNQPAYINFTCTFTGGLYVLTSGMTGINSSVFLPDAGPTDAATLLKLTAGSGATATQGSGAASFDPLPVPLYDLPTDCQEPLLLRYNFNGADYFLSKVESEREFYLNVFGTTVAPNKPLFFFDAGVNQATASRQIYIWPIADIVYTVFLTYMMDPTLVDLTTANLSQAIPVFPSYIQDALWKGALYHFLKNFDDQMGQVAKADYEAAKLEVEIADERDLDSDLQFRLDVGRRITDFRSPSTGIRLK